MVTLVSRRPNGETSLTRVSSGSYFESVGGDVDLFRGSYVVLEFFFPRSSLIIQPGSKSFSSSFLVFTPAKRLEKCESAGDLFPKKALWKYILFSLFFKLLKDIN